MSNYIIRQTGGTILFRQTGTDIQYLLDGSSNWITVNQFPIRIDNNNAAPGDSSKFLTIKITSNITTSSNFRFIFDYVEGQIKPNGEWLIYGHTQSNINFDGQNFVITLHNVSNYCGLIDSGSMGVNNMHVSNVNINATGTTMLKPGFPWIMQGTFADSSCSFCSSNGKITNGSCGIAGHDSMNSSTFVIRGCFTSGEIDGAGIAGNNFHGTIIDCYSTGEIKGGSGIVGDFFTGTVNSCNSSGTISGRYAGGIVGSNSNGATVNICYSTGRISGNLSGGIFGYNASNSEIYNCFTVGIIDFGAFGIGGGGNNQSITETNGNTVTAVYVANGSWSDTEAFQTLVGAPSVIPGAGTVWTSLGPGYTFSKNTSILNVTDVIQTTEVNVIEIIGNGFSSVNSVLVNNLPPLNFSIKSNSSIYVTMLTGGIIRSVNLTNRIGDEFFYELIIPIFPICFPAGTPVLTDQGIIPIEKINSKIHTIKNKKIVAITKTITDEKHLVCIEKDALGENVPSKRTIISSCHRVLYKEKLIPARNLNIYIENKEEIYNIKYSSELLYNVLMETHETMSVNNMIVETLHPENNFAKLYLGNYNKKKQITINKTNVCMKNNKLIKYRETSRKLM